MKAIIKIYQIEDVANTPYAFRGWNNHKELFTPDMKDYKEVAHFEYNEVDTVIEVLDKIFELGNSGTLKQLIPGMRSVSVSDIIEVNGLRFYVDDFGFTALGKVDNKYEEQLDEIKTTAKYLSKEIKKELSDYLKETVALMKKELADEDADWSSLGYLKDEEASRLFEEIASFTISWKLDEEEIIELDEQFINLLNEEA